MLTALEEHEELIIYLVASKEAVSVVLMTEREARQMPVYFVCRALRGPEVNYTSMEKLVLALVHASKRLKRYFQAHPIIVVIDQPIKNILSNPKPISRCFAHLSIQVLVEELKEKSVNEIEVLTVVEEEGDSWMTPIHEYLTDETLPSERKKTRTKKQNMHAGTLSVVSKALRIGYYWPTMHKDARALIKACQECQVHKPVQRNPQEKLNPITPSWPFYKWGIDITGPFPERPGKVKFLIVVMDYFTKWIEAKPVATITGLRFQFEATNNEAEYDARGSLPLASGAPDTGVSRERIERNSVMEIEVTHRGGGRKGIPG
ncbi:reverse transcriptase domain-containing protein [Tanacetum coccineum]